MNTKDFLRLGVPLGEATQRVESLGAVGLLRLVLCTQPRSADTMQPALRLRKIETQTQGSDCVATLG